MYPSKWFSLYVHKHICANQTSVYPLTHLPTFYLFLSLSLSHTHAHTHMNTHKCLCIYLLHKWEHFVCGVLQLCFSFNVLGFFMLTEINISTSLLLNYCHISGHPLAQPSWHIKLTVTSVYSYVAWFFFFGLILYICNASRLTHVEAVYFHYSIFWIFHNLQISLLMNI